MIHRFFDIPVNIFKHQLMENFDAQYYLRSRSITFQSVVKFDLGFCKTTLQHLNNFQNCITIPTRTPDGTIIGMFGRRIYNIQPKYEMNFSYKRKDAIFGLTQAIASIIQEGYAIITEGIFDVIMLHQFGFFNAIASPGKLWFPQQVALLRRFTNTALLCLDNDDAGRLGGEKCSKLLHKAGFFIRTIGFSNKFKDVDEFIRANGVHYLKQKILRSNNHDK